MNLLVPGIGIADLRPRDLDAAAGENAVLMPEAHHVAERIELGAVHRQAEQIVLADRDGRKRNRELERLGLRFCCLFGSLRLALHGSRRF